MTLLFTTSYNRNCKVDCSKMADGSMRLEWINVATTYTYLWLHITKPIREEICRPWVSFLRWISSSTPPFLVCASWTPRWIVAAWRSNVQRLVSDVNAFWYVPEDLNKSGGCRYSRRPMGALRPPALWFSWPDWWSTFDWWGFWLRAWPCPTPERGTAGYTDARLGLTWQ